MHVPRKKLCQDLTRNALREASELGGVNSLSSMERFRIFSRLMHAHVFPGMASDEKGPAPRPWNTTALSFSFRGWRHGGHRKLVDVATRMAWEEFNGIDYESFDLTPIRSLLGSAGPRFCTTLRLQDMADYHIRLKGLMADLVLLDSRLDRRHTLRKETVVDYRIDFREHTLTTRIHLCNHFIF